MRNREDGTELAPKKSSPREEKNKTHKNERGRPLFFLAQNAYVSKNPIFDFRAEGRALVTLETLAESQPDSAQWLRRFLVAAWDLHQNHPLYLDKAFLPRYHVSSKGMPFVLRRMEQLAAKTTDSQSDDWEGVY